MELCFDRRVPVSLDDRWCEVSIAVRWNDEAEVHESSEEELEVFEAIQNVVECDSAFNCRFALVVLQTGLEEGTFLVREPLGVFGEVWNDL